MQNSGGMMNNEIECKPSCTIKNKTVHNILSGPDNRQYKILDGPHIITNGDQTYYGFDVVEVE